MNNKKDKLEQDNPVESRDDQIQKHIDNLQKLITDTRNRRNENKKTELKKNHYISLDKNKEFDKKVIDSVADSIIDQSKTSDEVDDILDRDRKSVV